MDWHRPKAAGLALIAVLVALWSAAPALAQEPTDGDIRAALQEDSNAAQQALNTRGLDRLRRDGRFTIRVKPLVAGKLTARVKGKAFTAAYGEGTYSRPGSYRVTLRVTRAGRRYFKADRTANLQLKLDFRAAEGS
jgi:hypothetical protein